MQNPKLGNLYKNLTLNEIEPSGAEIIEAFKEIKRKAYNMKKIRKNYLIIDKEVIDEFLKI